MFSWNWIKWKSSCETFAFSSWEFCLKRPVLKKKILKLIWRYKTNHTGSICQKWCTLLYLHHISWINTIASLNTRNICILHFWIQETFGTFCKGLPCSCCKIYPEEGGSLFILKDDLNISSLLFTCLSVLIIANLVQ